MNVQDLEEIEAILKSEKAAELAAASTAADGGGPAKPLLPQDQPKPPVDGQLADDLTQVSTLVSGSDDIDSSTRFLKQADRLVRQYCRLSVIPTTETAVIEELRFGR